MAMIAKRPRLHGGREQDVLTPARTQYCYTQRAGVCAWAKRKFRRRWRRREDADARQQVDFMWDMHLHPDEMPMHGCE